MSTKKSRTNSSLQKMNRRKMIKKAGIGLMAGTAVGGRTYSMGDRFFLDTGFLAMWTHGNSLHVEYPGRMNRIFRTARHTRVEGKPGTHNRIHFPLPTPVVGAYWDKETGFISGKPSTVFRRYRLDKVFISFKTASVDARVTEVNVHDGQKRLISFPKLKLYGEHQVKEFDLPENPEILQGVCVTALVEFGKSLTWIEFISAGGDFFIVH